MTMVRRLQILSILRRRSTRLMLREWGEVLREDRHLLLFLRRRRYQQTAGLLLLRQLPLWQQEQHLP